MEDVGMKNGNFLWKLLASVIDEYDASTTLNDGLDQEVHGFLDHNSTNSLLNISKKFQDTKKWIYY
jgi:hypothetical protein